MRVKGAGACDSCGTLILNKKPSQRYCLPCSEKRDLDRKRRWARANPQEPDYVREKNRAAVSRMVQAGAELSLHAALGVAWMSEPEPPLSWLVRFSVPFSYAASKNHIYSAAARGHVFLRQESRDIRDLIEQKTRQHTASVGVVQAKVYLDMLIQKPDHKGDAVNVIDLVCDGVKRGLGVDDRWFCIRRVDWQIVKKDPLLFVGVGQAETKHHQVCSHCGRVMTLDQFNKKRRNRLGVDRACKDCRRCST